MSARGTFANPFHILVVEDNPGDADLLAEAFSRSDRHFTLAVKVDGEQAISHLRAEVAAKTHNVPDLIILDLNLPRMDGREVLRSIKTDDLLRQVPVIVFSSSSAERDLKEVYRLYGNCFITEPVELGEYFRVVKDIEKFWFTAAKIPPRVQISV